MISVNVEYQDLDGHPREDTLQFHLSELSALELEGQLEGGFEGFLSYVDTIRDIEDPTPKERSEVVRVMMDTMEKIVRLSYGKRTEAGGFRRLEEATEEFLESPAYSALIMSLLMDEELVAKFWEGIMPKPPIHNPPNKRLVTRK